MKITSISLVLVLVISMMVVVDMGFKVVPRVSGATIYVGGSGPGNYSTISEGVQAAKPGDTVFVYNGTYKEQIYFNKPATLVGEDMNSTILDGKDCVWGNCFEIRHDFVNISGFTFINWNRGAHGNGGIYIFPWTLKRWRSASTRVLSILLNSVRYN